MPEATSFGPLTSLGGMLDVRVWAALAAAVLMGLLAGSAATAVAKH